MSLTEKKSKSLTLPLTIVGVAIVFILGLVGTQYPKWAAEGKVLQEKLQKKVDTTWTVAVGQLKKLSADVGDDGRFIRHGTELDAKDAWGTTLRVWYLTPRLYGGNGVQMEVIMVLSAGPNRVHHYQPGLYGSNLDDDLAWEQRHQIPNLKETK